MADIELVLQKKQEIPSAYKRIEYVDFNYSYTELPVTTDYNVSNLYIDYQALDTYGVDCIYSCGTNTTITPQYNDSLRITNFSSPDESYDKTYNYYYGFNTVLDYIVILESYAPTTSRNIFERNKNGIFFNCKKPIPIMGEFDRYIPTGLQIPYFLIGAFQKYGGGTVYSVNSLKIYRFKAGNDNEWVYDLVPCQRIADDKVGLYDLVHDVFYVSQKSSEFIAGPDFVGDTTVDYKIDKFNGLKSVESLSQSTGDAREVFSGVVPNNGDIDIIDVNGDIAKMIQNDELPNSGLTVEIYVNNNKIQEHISTDGDYVSDSKTFDLTLSDKLSNWDKIIVPDIKPYSVYNMSIVLYNVLEKIGYTSNEISAMLSNKIRVGYNTKRDVTVQDYLNHIYVTSAQPYIKSETARNIINKICEATQLCCITKDDGNIYFISALPEITSDSEIIAITPNQQSSNFKYNLMTQIKYDNVKYTQRSMNTNIVETLNETYEFSYNPSTGVYDASKMNGQDIHTVTVGQTKCLVFFRQIQTYCEYIRYDGVNYPDDACDYEFKGGGSSTTSGITAILSIDSTIDNFNPTSMGIFVLSPYQSATSETLAFVIPLPTTHNVETFSLVVRGEVHNVDSDIVLYNSNNNIYELTENEFINKDYSYSYYQDSTSLYNLLCKNIVTDYSDGIIVGTLTVPCLNYYTTDGILIKDWSIGQTLELGDIVFICDRNYNSKILDKNNRDIFFKIVGRRFRYSGVPLLDLELQQIKTDIWKVEFYSDNVKLSQEFVIDENLVKKVPTVTKQGYTLTGWSGVGSSGGPTVILTTENILNYFEIADDWVFTAIWQSA